ncbi:MAG: acyltransferase family protein [Actinomycetota bacterium]
MRNGNRRLDVQGLRAVAVIMVVAFHAGAHLSGGFTGVDVFFVISGFVIAGLILRDAASDEGFSFKRFYARRARRLLPALALLIGVVTIASLLLQSPAVAQRATGRSGVAAALSLANYDIYRTTGGYFDTAAESNPLLHTWSLSVEEQFYLVFPLLVIIALALSVRTTRSKRLRAVFIALAFAGVGAISFGLALKLVHGTVLPGVALPKTFAFYAAPTRAWEFVAGVLLAVLLPVSAALPRWLTEALGVSGVLALVLAATRLSATSGVPGVATLLPVAGTAALITAGTAQGGFVSRLLAVRPMVRIGDLSYSIYLWHWPFIVFARLLFGPGRPVAALAALASLVVAWASFRWLEEPIHRGRRLRSWSGLRVAATSTAIAVVLAAAPYSLVKFLPNSSAVDAYIAAAGHPAQRTCEFESLEQATTGGCLIEAKNAKGTIYLIGDSHAGHFAAGVLSAAATMGWSARVETWNACPFILPGCARAIPSIEWLRTQPPGIVVLGLQSDGYVRRGEPKSEQPQIWADALRAFAKPLTEAGHSVLFIDPTPLYNNWDPRECLGLRVYADAARCGRTVARADAEAWRAPAVQAEREVALLPRVQVADFFDHFCDDRRCYTNRGNQWYAADADHLTNAASESLAGDFQRLFAAAASW